MWERTAGTDPDSCDHATAMTKEELLATLGECAANAGSGDYNAPEVEHRRADDALVEFINDPEIAEAYYAISKWYA